MLWQQPVLMPAEAKLAPWLAVGEAFVFLASPDLGLTAYSPEDGRTMWGPMAVATSAPVVAGSNVAVVSNGVLDVRQQETSVPAWHVDVGAAASLFALGDRFGVVVGQEIRVFGPNGTELWKANLGAAPVTPVVVRKGVLFVGLDAPSLVALDEATGVERWRIPLPAEPQSLAADDDQLYLGASDATVYAYLATGNPKPKWKFPLLRAVGQPIVDNRQVYFALLDNSVRALSRTGGTIRWSTVVTSRPSTGPIWMGTSLAVVLSTGFVEELAAKGGKAVRPATSGYKAEVTLQAAAASSDGTRLYTVTTTKDSLRFLTAWGRTVKR